MCHGAGIKLALTVSHMFRPFFLLDLPIAFSLFPLLHYGNLRWLNLRFNLVRNFNFQDLFLFQNRIRSQNISGLLWAKKKGAKNLGLGIISLKDLLFQQG